MCFQTQTIHKIKKLIIHEIELIEKYVNNLKDIKYNVFLL